MTAAAWVALAVTPVWGYVWGSLPFGLWVGRWARGLDIRQHGSGNLGATNVYRVLGPAWGIPVLLLDIFKGGAPLWLLPALPWSAAFPGGLEAASVTAGAAAIAGHVWTFLAGGKGGKGVATTVGVMLALAPLATAGCILLFLATLLLTRFVSVGSMLGALALPVLVAYTVAGGTASLRFKLSVALAILVMVRHAENLKRLFRGEEQRFSLKGGSAP